MIAYVPTEGDPAGVLALVAGACGSRPPVLREMVSERDGARWWGETVPEHGSEATGRRGLVLAWMGVAVAEGCDRAARLVILDGVNKEDNRVPHMQAVYTVPDAKWWGGQLVARFGGVLVDTTHLDDPTRRFITTDTPEGRKLAAEINEKYPNLIPALKRMWETDGYRLTPERLHALVGKTPEELEQLRADWERATKGGA